MTKIGLNKVMFNLNDSIDLELLNKSLKDFENIVPIDEIKNLKVKDIVEYISKSIL